MLSDEARRTLIHALRSLGGRATAKQVAASKGWKDTKASRDLGILFFAGVLDRENVGGTDGRQYLYSEKVAAPPVAPAGSTWSPPVRIAERESVG